MATTSTINLPGLLQTMFKDYEESREAKRGEYETGKGILQSVVEMFGPGYLKGEEKKMLADMEQSMVGRGLGGTTRPAAAGMGIKADIRDRATKARTGAMTNVAQYMAGFEDLAPTPGTLAHLATGGFSGMLEAEQFAASQPTKRYGEGSFAGSGLSYPAGGAAGRLGGGGGAGISGTTGGGTGWTPGGTPTTTGSSYSGLGTQAAGAAGGVSAPAQGFWGASEQWRSEQPSWVTGIEEPETGSVPMGGRTGPTTKEPTIAEYLQQHGLDPTSTDPGIMGRARTLQQQWADIYR